MFQLITKFIFSYTINYNFVVFFFSDPLLQFIQIILIYKSRKKKKNLIIDAAFIKSFFIYRIINPHTPANLTNRANSHIDVFQYFFILDAVHFKLK